MMLPQHEHEARNRPLRVLHLSKYDAKGGAARAAATSVRAQRALGIDALLHAGRVVGEDIATNRPNIAQRALTLLRFAAERLPFRLIGVAGHDVRSLGLWGDSPEALQRRYRPDLVMLHNIDGLIAIDALPDFSVPVLWRLHDMWALGGTRHYEAPSDSPLRGASARIDRWTWQRKARAYAAVRQLHLVPPSRWLAEEAATSTLTAGIPCTVVPNGVDTSVFQPTDRAAARERLGIAGNGPVLAFGAASGPTDPRKGFDLLLEALRLADAELKAANATLLIFGGDASEGLHDLGTRVISLGRISDQSKLVDIYNAADLFIAPSRQENLSLMVLESLACGTPVMAFAIGGMPDMIRPDMSGWLVPPFDVNMMAVRLREIVDAPSTARAMRASARTVAIREFSTSSEAIGMQALFQGLLPHRLATGIEVEHATR